MELVEKQSDLDGGEALDFGRTRDEAIATHGDAYLRMERVAAAVGQIGDLWDDHKDTQAKRTENRFYREEFAGTPVPNPEAARLRSLTLTLKRIVKILP